MFKNIDKYKINYQKKLKKLRPKSGFLTTIFLVLFLFFSFLNYLKVLTYTDKVSKNINASGICKQIYKKNFKNAYIYEFKNAYEKGKILCTYSDSRLNRIIFITKRDKIWVAGGQEGVGNKFIWPFFY